MALPATRLLGVVTAMLAALGCDRELVVDGSLPDVVASLDADRNVEGDLGEGGRVDGDADREPRPGPMTFVVRREEILLERMCDHDGDGLEDNAIAALGPGASTVMAAILTTAFQSGIEKGQRNLLHFPWIDDLGSPADDDAILIYFFGIDTVDRADTEDDFTGEEPFYVRPGLVDGCGEPRIYFEDLAIAALPEGGGRLDAPVGTFPVPVPDGQGNDEGAAFGFHDAELRATFAPWGTGAEVSLCGCLVAQELGAVPAVENVASTGSLSWLEVLSSGGASVGQPLIPGVEPDVDRDGDGLERFELDEEFHVRRCIDGDDAVIEGADCWQDERIADGFAMVVAFDMISAVCAGLEPGWEYHPSNPDDCSDPPETSLWDPR